MATQFILAAVKSSIVASSVQMEKSFWGENKVDCLVNFTFVVLTAIFKMYLLLSTSDWCIGKARRIRKLY